MQPNVIQLISQPIATDYLDALWTGVKWSHAAGNRREYYCNDIPTATYTYGTGKGERTYIPMPYVQAITDIKQLVQVEFNTVFEAVVLNGYADEKDSLGWHADDSPTMDDMRPIVVVSLGAERNIFTRPNAYTSCITSHRLASGSAFMMPIGYQDLYQHRIPKHDRPCGKRVSLTFRGYVQ